ncbi:MAG: hypothetical protein NTZ90_15655 [Proteobacteria bacterium]|nr:hypothetical protein [Pseudomonadota bacterium]
MDDSLRSKVEVATTAANIAPSLAKYNANALALPFQKGRDLRTYGSKTSIDLDQATYAVASTTADGPHATPDSDENASRAAEIMTS